MTRKYLPPKRGRDEEEEDYPRHKRKHITHGAKASKLGRRRKRADGGLTADSSLISGLLEGGRNADDVRWRDMVQNAGGGSFGKLGASIAGDPGAATNAAQSRQMGNQASSFFRNPNQLPIGDPRWRKRGGSAKRR